MAQESYGIHWFRRDLRVAGNPALQWNRERHQGHVVGLFAFDSKFLSRPDIGINRFAFFIETIRALREELRAIGSDLLVLELGPDEAFRSVLEGLRDTGRPLPATVSFNRDYEPFALDRDARVEQLIQRRYGVEVHHERDHLLLEPREISKNDGSYYQVYTPFSRKWVSLLETDEIRSRVREQKQGLSYLKKYQAGKAEGDLFKLTWKQVLGKKLTLEDRLEIFRKEVSRKADVPIPQAGSLAALEMLERFEGAPLKNYQRDRDRPAVSGTSKLSIFLKNGSITTGQVIAALNLKAGKNSAGKFLSELIWREFYYHILFHCPRVETSAFQFKYEKLKWENREDYWQAWCEGKTGFPIVDAGMRQLNTTGWMHNRVRMIVASFLTKDLHVDYKWGERYFMQKLLDGDLAPNNGGWQWAASTGCDPQPYFRVFNPALQAKRYDPKNEYIRRFVPEYGTSSYPRPIVDHSQRAKRAVEMFKKCAR